MIYDLNNTYVIRFYHDVDDEWRYFVRHKSDPYRYKISSTKDLQEAKVFEDADTVDFTADLIATELHTEVRVHRYDEKELFKVVLSGK